jgi:predicted chitinase
MLISSPFLPTPVAGETKDQYLDRSMVVGTAGDGGFPVSFEMNWHGGVHLSAPSGASQVRAIADGKVSFMRQPTARSTDPTHPLNYRGGWTDDGVIVVKHETDIGAIAAVRARPAVAATATTPAVPAVAAAPAVVTKVIFFSVYLHLGTVKPLAVNDNVFRMNELGTAGSIYGARDRIHLEIVCDDANVLALTGRNTPQSVTTADGRTDVIFGKIWYFVPTGAAFLQSDPLARPRRGRAPGLPPVQFTSTADMLISVEFVGMNAVVTSHDATGVPLGASATSANYVGQLMRRAAGLFPQSQSAGVELMRYGRAIGPEPVNPTNAPNWLQAPHPGGTGFVDVNAAGVRRMSDGDFPSWDFGGLNRGWVLVDGSSSKDSRSTDPGVIKLLDLNKDQVVPVSEATAALADPNVQLSLSHKICKFPTEWDPATIDQRLSFLRDEAPAKLTAAEYQKLRAHVNALCFWSGSGPGIAGTHWHFHPREFIRQFKKCIWLSQRELAQCIPRKMASLTNSTFGVHANASFANALSFAAPWTPGISLMMRKHLISESPERVAHFLAQVIAETGLQFVVEKGGASQPYSPLYGRGLIQLTKPNYAPYGVYRGFPSNFPTTNPLFVNLLGWDPDALIARTQTVFDAENSADTAGFYWLTHSPSNNGLLRSDGGIALADIVTVSKYVNGEFAVQTVNGIDHRLSSFLYMKYILLDLVRPSSNKEQLTFTWRRQTQKEPVFDTLGNPVISRRTGRQAIGFMPGSHTVDFPLDHQKP